MQCDVNDGVSVQGPSQDRGIKDEQGVSDSLPLGEGWVWGLKRGDGTGWVTGGRPDRGLPGGSSSMIGVNDGNWKARTCFLNTGARGFSSQNGCMGIMSIPVTAPRQELPTSSKMHETLVQESKNPCRQESIIGYRVLTKGVIWVRRFLTAHQAASIVIPARVVLQTVNAAAYSAVSLDYYALKPARDQSGGCECKANLEQPLGDWDLN